MNERVELLQLALMCRREAEYALMDRPRRLDDAAAWTEAASLVLDQWDALPARRP